ncbi:MAG: hypothetical protein WB952_20215 [Terriglobales bacterium]
MYLDKTTSGSAKLADGRSSTPREETLGVENNQGNSCEERLSAMDITALREFFELLHSLQKFDHVGG